MRMRGLRYKLNIPRICLRDVASQEVADDSSVFTSKSWRLVAEPRSLQMKSQP